MSAAPFVQFGFYQLAWYFLLYAFLGWCIEVVFCSVNTGKFVNRGFLNGPVCPIYGFGATIVIWALSPLASNLLLLFLGSILVTSLLELITGFLLKKLFHTSWWDYSDQPFNIGGYICLKFSLAWGLACLLLVRILHPVLADLVDLVPHLLGIVLLCVLYAAFLSDFAVTLAAMLKLRRDLGEISRVAEGLHKGSEAMAKGLGNSAIAMAEKVEEGRQKASAAVAETKEQLEAALQQNRQKRAGQKENAQAQTEALLERNPRIRRRLLRAFPHMQSSKFAAGLEQLKQHLNAGKTPEEDEGKPKEKKNDDQA